MKKFLYILTGKHSIIMAVVILFTLDVLLIIGLMAPPIQEYVLTKRIFEIVVVMALIEVLILVSSSIWRVTPIAYGSEEEAQEKIQSLLSEDGTVQTIKVLSAGLSSRASFLRGLLELPRRLNLEIVACFTEANPDKLDRTRFGPTNIEVLTHRLKPHEASRLKIYQSYNTPSFRCVLLLDSVGPRYGFIGWYRYENRNNHVIGRRNIQIFVDRTTDFGSSLLHFAEQMFKIYSDPKEAEVLVEE